MALPLDAHPEGEPLVALRIQPAVLEHDRVDHACPEDRHPAGPRAGRTADAATHEALDVEGHGRLGEGVVAGSEPRALVRAVEGLGELVEQPAQVAHRRALVDHQALDLEELRGVAGVDGFVSVAAARQEGPDRRRLLVHDPDLAGRGVGPQQVALDVDVERVPQVARRVIERDVEHLEVAQVVLDLGRLVDDESELPEHLGDRVDGLVDRVERAAPDRPAGRRDVDRLGLEPARQRRAAQDGAAVGERALDGHPDGVGDGADTRPVVRRERTDPAEDARQPALLAEDVELERLEGGHVRRGRDRRQGLVAQRLQLAGQIGEVHVRPSMSGPGIRSPRASATSRAGLRVVAVGVSPAWIRRPWRARRSGRRWPRREPPGRPGSCGRSRRPPS